jgi:Disulphide bond corrector protein DsbC
MKMKKIILAIVVMFFTAASYAQIENPVKWTYTAKKISADTYELHLTATLQPKWHIYSQDIKGDGPVPTSITLDKNPLVKTDGAVAEIGKVEQEYNKDFKLNLKFYSNKVDFVQKVKVKAGVATVAKGKVTFMVCDDKKCLPPKDLAFSIKINPKG